MFTFACNQLENNLIFYNNYEKWKKNKYTTKHIY